jgi:hypothetical protein
MMRCWKRSPLGKPLRFHRCTRSLNAVCKCKMCTSALSMDGQRWFRCRWWSVDSPLQPRRHRCRWLTWDRLHPLLWTSIWRHHRRLDPLQRQLLAVLHLHRRQWSSGPSLPVVDSLLALLMPREAASFSLAIAPVEWPRLPPPTGGPNGPRFGRRVGRTGEGVGSGAASPGTGTLCGAGPALDAGHRQRSARATCSARRGPHEGARRGPPAALGTEPAGLFLQGAAGSLVEPRARRRGARRRLEQAAPFWRLLLEGALHPGARGSKARRRRAPGVARPGSHPAQATSARLRGPAAGGSPPGGRRCSGGPHVGALLSARRGGQAASGPGGGGLEATTW